jgi:hypothetical protein
MARRIIDKLLYDALLEAYRIKPANHSHAADYAGCDRRMAKRAYDKGWPKHPWAVPVEQVLHDDNIRARAKRQEMRTQDYLEAEDKAEKAKQDATDARAQEGKMVVASRQSALGLIGFSMRLLQSGRPLVERLADVITNSPDEFSSKQQLSLLKEISRFTSQSVAVCHEAMRLERLHMGEPEAIVGVTDLTKYTTEDLVSELKDIEAALRGSSDEPSLRLVNEPTD